LIKVLLLILTISLAGCTTVETETKGRRIQSDSVMQIKPGITTRASIINLFGNPTEISHVDGVETFLYTYKEEKTPLFFGGLLQLESQKRSSSKSLELVIKDGIVLSYRFLREKNIPPEKESPVTIVTD
jgi:outer membrane protein assembly factor BamE (lipoprotein component of BamABCDE complex)